MKNLKSSIIGLIMLLPGWCPIYTQNIPEGYLLQYQQNFSDVKALADFTVDHSERWGVFKRNSNFYLQCSAVDSAGQIPANIAVLKDRIFGDFILEADIMPVDDSAASQEICLFLGMRYPHKYYYIQFSSVSDSSHNGIFLLKNQKIIRLTGDPVKPVSWNRNKWHKVRLERNIVKRTITVYLDNSTLPFFEVKDYELVMGSIAFGSFTTAAGFDNIKIWAPTVLTEEELKQME